MTRLSVSPAKAGSWIGSAATGEIESVGLAPVAVVPKYQRRGVAAAFVLGDPAYYARFGFSAETAKGIAGPYSGPAWQALELTKGALHSVAARVTYPAAFNEVEAPQ